MKNFVAQRLIFQNGERHSVLVQANGIPVHEVTLYLDKFRSKGRAANTIHYVCTCLALLYRELEVARVKLLDRLAKGEFLTLPELERLVSAARYRSDAIEEEPANKPKTNVIDIRHIGIRRSQKVMECESINVQTYASRLRYIADYLSYISRYVGATLPREKRRDLDMDTERSLKAFRQHIPRVTKRAKLGTRVGLSIEEQERVLEVIHPDSDKNPWTRGFVRLRNWVIVVVLLATGMRRGELLGLQLEDIPPNLPLLNILRRADTKDDKRMRQPNAKTSDRTVEISTPVMRALQLYLRERRRIKAARKIKQVIVSEDGNALSMQSIDKIFKELRTAVPGLPVVLTCHVMRHTWNERFSEQADAMKLPEVAEQRARNSHQGWGPNSKIGADYTKRHAERKGRELSMKLQEKLEKSLDEK